MVAGHDHSKAIVEGTREDVGVVDLCKQREGRSVEEESDMDSLGFTEVHASHFTP